MKIIEIKVYAFDELSDDAKARARAWYQDGALDYNWWESTYEDAKMIGLQLKSFDLDRNRHATGEFTDDACHCADLIIKNHGVDCETYKTAEAFLKARDEIVDTAPKDADSEFENQGELDDKLDNCESEFLKSVIEDYSIILQEEMEWLLSDEQVDESIRANEYTFTETGKRFD